MRCLLLQAGLAETFREEATQTANFIRNVCRSKAINNEVPFEVWFNRRLNNKDLERLKTFGCEAWAAVVNPNKRRKLGPRAKKCLYLGFEDGVKGYRLWSVIEKRVIIARDVKFEDVFPCRRKELYKILM